MNLEVLVRRAARPFAGRSSSAIRSIGGVLIHAFSRAANGPEPAQDAASGPTGEPVSVLRFACTETGFCRRVTTRHTGRSNACAHRRGLCAQTHFACSSAGALRMRKIVSSPTANSAGVGDAQLRCAAHRHVRLMSMNAQPVAAQVIRQPGRMTGQCERGRLAKPTSKVSASL